MTIQRFLPLVFLVACGSDDIRPEDLRPPSAVWNHEAGNCGKTIAIDGNNDLWDEKGCEDGSMKLSKVRKLSADEAKEILRSFEVLVGLEGGSAQCPISRHYFTLTTDMKRQWLRCGTGRGSDDLGGLEPPFLDAAKSLNDLRPFTQ